MNTLLIERPGALTTLQDLGRFGHQQYGVSVNGPMDEWSHRLANALVGNAPNAAVLECTLTGPKLIFSVPTLIALCGARMKVAVDGRLLPYDRAVLLGRGAVLDVGERTEGARLYIAIRGGLDTDKVLGSRATNIRAGFGGFHGRPLRKGDRLKIGSVPRDAALLPIEKRGIQSGLPVMFAAPVEVARPERDKNTVRFIAGPQWSRFTKRARTVFEAESFQVTAQSDRMGARLQGAPLMLEEPLELISEATAFGTVQVPPEGQPIVLMADRQSAGGYPKIAYVASADLPLLAQSMPGDALRFKQISQEDAEMTWRDFETKLRTAHELSALALSR